MSKKSKMSRIQKKISIQDSKREEKTRRERAQEVEDRVEEDQKKTAWGAIELKKKWCWVTTTKLSGGKTIQTGEAASYEEASVAAHKVVGANAIKMSSASTNAVWNSIHK